MRRDALHDIHISFSCDQAPQPDQAPKTGLSAGADFGLKDFLTLSTGQRIAAPQPLNAQLRRLRKAQRVLSRKQKGSKARSRARLDVARVHSKVADVRTDWQWKQARMLLLTYDLLAFDLGFAALGAPSAAGRIMRQRPIQRGSVSARLPAGNDRGNFVHNS